MNVLCILVVVLALVLGALSAETSRNVSKIEQFLYDRCRIYSTDASAYDEVKNHYSHFSDYLGYTASLLPNGKQQFCVDEKTRLIGLMKQLTHDMKPCFPKEEKYLPQFMYESFVDFLNFVCAEKNVENFFSSQGSECRASLKNQQAGLEVGDCFRKLFANLDGVVKKENLCLDLKLSKTCFGEAIARYCPNFAGYESLNNKFFDAIRKPCNSGITFGITTIIMIAAFLSTKVFS